MLDFGEQFVEQLEVVARLELIRDDEPLTPHEVERVSVVGRILCDQRNVTLPELAMHHKMRGARTQARRRGRLGSC